MSDQITIPRRFRGPPTTGNGGYVAGLLAGYVNGDAEVTLRLPPPLERPLDVLREDGVAKLMDGDKLVAEARPAQIDVAAPDAPTWDQAAAAAKRGYENRHNEQYNSCFVCGLERGPGDGLCIYPGPITEGSREMLATWVPDATVAHPDGMVPPEIVWSALDCPSGFPYIQPSGVVVLGRYAVKRMAPVRRDERYIVRGWRVGQDGRKLHSAAALYSEDGVLCAVAKATWIEIDETPEVTT